MKKKILPSNEVALFCEQIAMILRSGMPLHDGLEALMQHYHESRYADHFQKLYESIDSGDSFYDSLKELNLFPEYMVNAIRIAEITGKLEQTAESLADYYRKDDMLKKTIRQALLYPGVLIALMAIVVTVLVVKVLPVFNSIYQNLGTTLYSSSSLMNTGNWIGMIVLIVIGLVILLALISFILIRTGKKERVLVFWGRLFLPLRRLRTKISAQRFSAAVSMLLVGGHPVGEAVHLAKAVVDDGDFLTKIDQLYQKMQEEQSFADAIVSTGVFNDLHNRMIKVGATTGQTDHVLNQLSEIYADEADEMILSLVSMIEPSCVVVLSVAIGGILLAAMLPLIGIIGSIGM